MKLNYNLGILLIITFFSNNITNAQAPVIEWQKSLGGTGIDNASSIIKTTDGGYVIAGNSQSNNGDVTGNHGSDDFWIVKLNSTGTIQWQKSLGGTNIEYANSIIQTIDGGFIVAGSSQSNNGDVSGNHGSGDIWIVKLNSDAGVIEWQKSLGGSSFDWATSIKQTSDGGYIIAGNSQSNNGDVTGNHGFIDYWIVKISSIGTIQWQKTLGGTGDDRATSIIQTIDGGYVVAGYCETNNGDVTGNQGIKDYWIIKLSSAGVIQWKRCLGGTHVDLAHSIKQTSDGGFIVAGHAFSSDGDVIGNDGGTDFWIVKLNSDASVIEWQKSLGGTETDLAYSINQTTDGGYIITGASNSNDGDVTGHHGIQMPKATFFDYWVVKLNSTGTIQWQKSLGGITDDYAASIIQTTDGGYIVAGSSNSTDGDVTGNHGSYDYWIVKLSPENLSTSLFNQNKIFSLFPNPAKENLTLKIEFFTPSQEITITDIQGKKIHSQKVEGLSTTINTSNFEKGIYFLNLIDGTQKTTQKFIIE